jgi:hypothetical protein
MSLVTVSFTDGLQSSYIRDTKPDVTWQFTVLSKDYAMCKFMVLDDPDDETSAVLTRTYTDLASNTVTAADISFADCPTRTGEYAFRVEVYRVNGEVVTLEATAQHSFLVTDAAQLPAPTITSPAGGSNYYINVLPKLKWTDNVSGDDPDLHQQNVKIEYRIGSAGTWQTFYEGACTAYEYQLTNIAAAYTDIQRYTYVYWRVYTKLLYNTWSEASNLRGFNFVGVYPDAGDLTKPANGATFYTSDGIDIAILAFSYGGYTTQQMRVDWYATGETEWAHTIIRTPSSTAPDKITIAAGTFPVGEIHLRAKIKTDYNGGTWGAYGAERVIYVQSSAPEQPIISAPTGTQYNHQNTEYQWEYDCHAGLAQANAEIRYKLTTDETWTTVTVSGDATSITINHIGISGVMTFQIRVQNTGGEWSEWSAVASYTLATPIPVAAIVSPLGGYVDRTQAQTFSWTYTSPIDAAQAAYELGYKLAGASEYTVLSGGAATSVTIPAGTLPTGNVVWRVRVQDGAERWSDWTADQAIATVDAVPSKPTLISPMDGVVRVNDTVRFNWIHNNSIGTAQTAADVRYRQSETDDWTTITVSGATQTASLIAFTLSPGTAMWQARTYNTDNVAGEWSDTAYFSVAGAATTPTITAAAANGMRPSVGWTATGQIVYEVEFMQGGAVIESVRDVATSDSAACVCPNWVPAGQTTMRVRNQNAYGYWSDWASVTVTVAACAYAAPEIAAYASGGVCVRVIISADRSSLDRLLLYRDGVPVARISGTEYADYSVTSGAAHAYFARAVFTDGSYKDSQTVTVTAQLACAMLSPASTPGEIVYLRIARDAAPSGSEQLSGGSAQVELIGRMLPMTVFGENETRSHVISAAVKRAEYDALRALWDARGVALYRDGYGRRDYCRIGGLTTTGLVLRGGVTYMTVSLTLDATDYDEGMEV